MNLLWFLFVGCFCHCFHVCFIKTLWSVNYKCVCPSACSAVFFFFTWTHFWCFSFLSLLFPCLSPPHSLSHYGLHHLAIPRIPLSDLNCIFWLLFSLFLFPIHILLHQLFILHLCHFFLTPHFLDCLICCCCCYSAARHPTFSSSSLLIAGCCGCEEGRGSNSEMRHFAKSKAVSGARSAVQVQAKGMPLAHLILLTMGINWPFEYKSLWRICFQNCIVQVAAK